MIIYKKEEEEEVEEGEEGVEEKMMMTMTIISKMICGKLYSLQF
jgi:hypothetical protein